MSIEAKVDAMYAALQKAREQFIAGQDVDPFAGYELWEIKALLREEIEARRAALDKMFPCRIRDEFYDKIDAAEKLVDDA